MMNTENFLVDKRGRKIAVQIPLRVYEKLIADAEELDEIKEYRKAKSQKGHAIPFEKAFNEIEKAIQ